MQNLLERAGVLVVVELGFFDIQINVFSLICDVLVSIHSNIFSDTFCLSYLFGFTTLHMIVHLMSSQIITGTFYVCSFYFSDSIISMDVYSS
jgi:hypothetical protein